MSSMSWRDLAHKVVQVLNRIVRWTESGLEYKADPRQIEHIIVDLGLESAKTVDTAGVKLDAAKGRVDQVLG